MKKLHKLFLSCNFVITVVAGILGFTIFSCKEKISDQTVGTGEISLSEKDFFTVPGSDRLWVYYWWLKGNVTKESITQDLEEMKRKGIGGFLLFDSRGYWDDYINGIIPVPLKVKMEFMSPEWREMVRYTMQEASRLGLEMSINLANTGGSLRGPWDMGEDGPKKLIWTSASVSGPAKFTARIKNPLDKRYFRDVKLMAVKVRSGGILSEEKAEADLNSNWKDVIVPGENAVSGEKTVLLENELKDGLLSWDVPDGNWQIIRFGSHVIADTGSVDILNREAVKKYFNLMGKEILDDAGPLAGKTLKYLYNVSWEGGEPNWTPGFEKEFLRFRGYEIGNYMPVLAGLIVNDHHQSLRFMRDYFRTVSDCFVHNCYKTIGELCNARGVKWHSENGGPWQRDAAMFREADMLSFWGANDIPQGEFWCDDLKSLSGRTNSRYTSMASHIYGQPLSAIEAFTHMTYHWSKYPEYLKPFADANFIDGSNMFIWHTFTASPSEIGKPGFEYFAGTHINPRVTWWEMAGDFISYIGRCQYMLRQGKYVADICCYISDKNYVRWGRGEKWNDKSALFPEPGYKYDLIDTEVLVNRLSVKDGRLVLPDGMSYGLMVVDPEDQTIPSEALAKILLLVKSGATVVLGQNKPVRTPGLKNFPECDKEISAMADELWGTPAGKFQKRKMGKGILITGSIMNEVCKDLSLLPDFQGPFEFIHRSGTNADIYFIRGTGKAECIFRVSGMKPEIWDPVEGMVTDVVNYRYTDDNRTVIPLELPVNGSVFILFSGRKVKKYITELNGPEKGFELIERNNDTLRFVLWKSGNYVLKSSGNKLWEIKEEVLPEMNIVPPCVVRFTPGRGAPETAVFENLVEWNKHSDKGIRYFSGTGTYTFHFPLTAEQVSGPCRLRIGKVFNIARVRLNGNDLGVVWTAPWMVDISNSVNPGSNKLEIEVANCWANRLIGDAGLPVTKRFTRTNVRLLPDRGKYRSYEAWSAKDTLLPSGLIGPVRIEFGKEHKVGL